MITIAFLGTGLMGTGFVQRARANGLTVRAWNRSAPKAQAANDAAGGVTACATVAQAVQGGKRIHLTLLGLLGFLGDVGRLAAAVGIDLKDSFSLFEHLQPRPDAAAARQAHQCRAVRPAVVRDVDGEEGFAADGGGGGAWRAGAPADSGAGEVVG